VATSAKRATGEILTAPKVDSVNTFAAPNAVAPKPLTARASGGKIKLELAPHSVAVVALEQ
jgi:alpha-N-arabinofuranosidase